MGLIKELVLLPIAPVRGVGWVAERIAEQVEQEHMSPGAAVRQIDELEEKRERRELSEEEAAQLEQQILEQQLSREDEEAVNGG